MLSEIQIFIIQIIDFRKCYSKVTCGKNLFSVMHCCNVFKYNCDMYQLPVYEILIKLCTNSSVLLQTIFLNQNNINSIKCANLKIIYILYFWVSFFFLSFLTIFIFTCTLKIHKSLSLQN